MQDAVSQDGTEAHGRESTNKSWSLVKDFCDYTSAHGLGRIMAATHWTQTVLWTMLLLGATTIMTVQVHTLFQKYQRRELTTLMTVETSKVRFDLLVPFRALNIGNVFHLVCLLIWIQSQWPIRLAFISGFFCMNWLGVFLLLFLPVHRCVTSLLNLLVLGPTPGWWVTVKIARAWIRPARSI